MIADNYVFSELAHDLALMPSRRPAPVNGTRAEKDAWIQEAVDAADQSLRAHYAASDLDTALSSLDAALGTKGQTASPGQAPDLTARLKRTREAARTLMQVAISDISPRDAGLALRKFHD